MVFFTLLGVTFFCRLGLWQLARAQEKSLLFAQFGKAQSAQAALAKPLTLAGALGAIAAERYVPVVLTGMLLPGKTVLLDNQTQAGVHGVQVFQLLQTDDNQQLLVALGFLPAAQDRSAFPAPEVQQGPLLLRGLLAPPPSTGLRMGQDADAAGAQLLITRFDWPALERFFGRAPILPYVLLLAPESGPTHSALNAGTPYLRQWRPATFTAQRHQAYATTWFGLALTVLATFLLLHRKKRSPL
jgi:surfeit locus 1 family protein